MEEMIAVIHEWFEEQMKRNDLEKAVKRTTLQMGIFNDILLDYRPGRTTVDSVDLGLDEGFKSKKTGPFTEEQPSAYSANVYTLKPGASLEEDDAHSEHEKQAAQPIDLLLYAAVMVLRYEPSYSKPKGLTFLELAKQLGSSCAVRMMTEGSGTYAKEDIHVKNELVEFTANDVFSMITINIRKEEAAAYEQAIAFIIRLLKQGFPKSYKIKLKSSVKQYLPIKGLAKSDTHRFFANALAYPELAPFLEEYAREAIEEFEFYEDTEVACLRRSTDYLKLKIQPELENEEKLEPLVKQLRKLEPYEVERALYPIWGKVEKLATLARKADGRRKELLRMSPVREVHIAPMLVECSNHSLGWIEVTEAEAVAQENVCFAEELEKFKLSDLNQYELHQEFRLVRQGEAVQIFLFNEDLTLDYLIKKEEKSGFGLLTEDEWEYLYGGGCRTLFPWGDSFDYTMKLKHFGSLEGLEGIMDESAEPGPSLLEEDDRPYDLELPNFFGIQFAGDPYNYEFTLDASGNMMPKGGDGGAMICGGMGPLAGFLPAAAVYYRDGNAGELDWEEMIDFMNYRRVIRLADLEV
ncbi:hypothetical protein G195_001680 [Phytophthora kernoviae 00238/432]|uniref:Uncharacterized protein n=1 Tax=Phytophthora kernoviae 00238/432 TaxID=1284355 RepID=A0A8J4STF0_9STRA|nr:hypothetical protein G195_001680 [Phytophthora kernoviae 00238/432]